MFCPYSSVTSDLYCLGANRIELFYQLAYIDTRSKVTLALCSRKPRKGVRMPLFFGNVPEEGGVDWALAAAGLSKLVDTKTDLVYQYASGGSRSMGGECIPVSHPRQTLLPQGLGCAQRLQCCSFQSVQCPEWG